MNIRFATRARQIAGKYVQFVLGEGGVSDDDARKESSGLFLLEGDREYLRGKTFNLADGSRLRDVRSLPVARGWEDAELHG